MCEPPDYTDGSLSSGALVSSVPHSQLFVSGLTRGGRSPRYHDPKFGQIMVIEVKNGRTEMA